MDKPLSIIVVNPDIGKLVTENDGYCPCAIEHNPDTKCICKAFREQTEPGECHCGRFMKDYPQERMWKMNRAERRERLKEMKRDPLAHKCPACGNKTLQVAKPTRNHTCDIVCLYCDAVLVKESNTAIPWTYV